MVEALEQLFGNSSRVLVKDGEFNNVKGEYHYENHRQVITNDGCYNIVDNKLHNVGNKYPQVYYHETSVRSTQHGRSATTQVTTFGASVTSSPNYPRAQVPIRNNQAAFPFGQLSRQSHGQHLGQHICVQAGDIRQMSGGQFALMNKLMAHMKQEMESEFGREDEETFDDETARRSQSLSVDFTRLTIEASESSSSPRSPQSHGSSSTAAGESPRYTTIEGDHTEEDNSVHQTDIDSHIVRNNTIINSFGEGEQKDTQAIV